MPTKLISSAGYFVESIWFSAYSITSSEKYMELTSFFSTWLPFMSLFCLISLSRTCTVMLNTSSMSRHSCLNSYFSRKLFSLSTSSMMVAVFHTCPLSGWGSFPSLLGFGFFFFNQQSNRYWILWNEFFCFYYDDHMFFLLFG